MAKPDYDNVLGGPGEVQVDDTQVGHTEGGISVNVTPNTKEVTVDQYGNTPVNSRHLGDSVRMNAPFAEWSADVLANAYAAGDAQTAAAGAKFMGIGRSAGFLYTPKDVKAIPMLTADAAKLVQLFRACPVGAIDFSFDEESDRILGVEFAGLVDSSKDDGQLVGKIGLTSA